MKKILFLVVLPVMLLVYGSTYGQKSDCQVLMDKYAKKISGYGLPGEKQHYFLHMDMTSVPVQPSPYTKASLDQKTVELKVITTGQKLFYESTYLAIYQDEKDVYTVVHPQKIIIHSKPDKQPKDAGKEVLAKQLNALQQDFLTQCQIASCKDTVYEGQMAKVMSLIPTADNQKKYHIRRITNYLLSEQNAIAKQVIEFAQGHQLARQVIVYHTMDLDYKGKMPKSAAASVFASPGKVLAKYKGYRFEEE